MLAQVAHIIGIVDSLQAAHVPQEREHAALHVHVTVHFHAHADGPERFRALPPPHSEHIGAGVGQRTVIVLKVVHEAVAGKVVGIILVLDDVHHIFEAQRVRPHGSVDMADAGQVNKALDRSHGGIQLQAVLGNIHKIGRAQVLGTGGR